MHIRYPALADTAAVIVVVIMYACLHHGRERRLCSCCRIATAGKLWGPALLLARSCGDSAFTETASAMAEGAATAGSPLHTLTLLLSGKPDAVHAEPAAVTPAAEPSSFPFAQAVQSRSAALLSQWRGNLAILAANRVAGDEAAMVKLGDRLWQERGQVYFLCMHFCRQQTPRFHPVAAILAWERQMLGLARFASQC